MEKNEKSNIKKTEDCERNNEKHREFCSNVEAKNETYMKKKHSAFENWNDVVRAARVVYKFCVVHNNYILSFCWLNDAMWNARRCARWKKRSNTCCTIRWNEFMYFCVYMWVSVVEYEKVPIIKCEKKNKTRAQAPEPHRYETLFHCTNETIESREYWRKWASNCT